MAEVSSALRDKVKGCLYGLLIGDALASPTHWFYGSYRQVASLYGGPITGYTAPVERLPGSIMSKSSTGADGGRGSFKGDVIGGVIFHDKKRFWAPGEDYHYHVGLRAGENTLEALLVRRVLAVTAANAGRFDPAGVVDDYVTFMTTPGTHNDTYCGTAHRMFFGRMASGKPLSECPSNDGHNVDTIDALVTTVPVALIECDDSRVAAAVGTMVSLTRSSKPAPAQAAAFASLLRSVIRGEPLKDAVTSHARAFSRQGEASAAQGQRARGRSGNDPLTACYLDSAIPAMLFMVAKYAGTEDSLRTCLLANANRGGENVAAGALLGALFGADVGFEAIPAELKTGLVGGEEAEAEIEAFLSAIPFLA